LSEVHDVIPVLVSVVVNSLELPGGDDLEVSHSCQDINELASERVGLASVPNDVLQSVVNFLVQFHVVVLSSRVGVKQRQSEIVPHIVGAVLAFL
jgi:hypothetical protein